MPDASNDASHPADGAAEGGEGGSDGGFVPPDCTGAPVATWTKIYNEVVSPNCGNYCHNGSTSDTKGGGLDLFPTDSSRAYGNLVNQAPKSNPSGLAPPYMYECTGKGMRVVPNNPEMSIVYSKLIGQPICGFPMPHGTPDGTMWTSVSQWVPLPTSQICDFYTWIKAGAQQN